MFGSPADPVAWRGHRDRIRRLMGAGDWLAAHRNLQVLLRDHGGAAHAMAERESVLADVRTIAFHRLHPATPLADMVEGELLSWNPRSRGLRLRYAPVRSGDLQSQPTGNADVQAWLHPAVFPGDVTLHLEIPAGRSGEVQLLLGVTGKGVVYASPGDAQRPCSIVYVAKGGAPKMLASVASPWAGASGGEMVVRFQRGRLTVQRQGRTVLVAQHRIRDHKVGVLAQGGVRSGLTVEGKTDGRWVGGLQAADERERERRFVASYRAEDHAPDWLLHGVAGEQATEWSASAKGMPSAEGPSAEGPSAEGPSAEGPSAEGPRATGGPASRVREGGDGVGAAGATPAMPAGVRAALQAGQQALAAGDLITAADHAQAAVDALPGHADPMVLWARVRLAAGQYGEAAGILDRVLAAHPGHGIAAVDRALLALDQGDPDHALKILRRARTAGCGTPGLLRVQRIVDRAQRGPTWRRTSVHTVDGAVVRSDAGRDVCIEVARLVQEAQRHCTRIYGPPPREARRMRVYVFRDRDGMADYIRGFGTPVHGFAAGVYLPRLQQLVVWRDGVQRSFRHAVHHEAVHGEIHRRFGLVPVWWNEGQAERLAGQLGEGLAAAHANTLARTGMLPISEWINLDAARFYGRSGSYAQAWLLADLLAEGWRGLPRELQRDLGESGGLDPARVRGLSAAGMELLDRAMAARLEHHQRQRMQPAPR